MWGDGNHAAANDEANMAKANGSKTAKRDALLTVRRLDQGPYQDRMALEIVILSAGPVDYRAVNAEMHRVAATVEDASAGERWIIHTTPGKFDGTGFVSIELFGSLGTDQGRSEMDRAATVLRGIKTELDAQRDQRTKRRESLKRIGR